MIRPCAHSAPECFQQSKSLALVCGNLGVGPTLAILKIPPPYCSQDTRMYKMRSAHWPVGGTFTKLRYSSVFGLLCDSTIRTAPISLSPLPPRDGRLPIQTASVSSSFPTSILYPTPSHAHEASWQWLLVKPAIEHSFTPFAPGVLYAPPLIQASERALENRLFRSLSQNYQNQLSFS